MSKLRPCKECGTKVSRKAKICPNCGYQNPASQKQYSLGNFFLLVVFFIVLYNIVTGPTQPANISPIESSNRAALLETVKAESRVKTASISGPQLWAGLINDGSDRTGYAMYLCEVARDYNVSNIIIRILDVHKLVANNNGHKNYSIGEMTIGKFHCKR